MSPRTLARRAVLLAATVPWAGWAVLRATGTERGFPLVPALAFTPYAAVTSLVPLALALRSGSRSATAVAATSTAVLAGAVLRRSGGRRGAAPTGERLVRLTSVNLRLGLADPQAVVDLVRRCDVDVLALQEVTPAAERGLLAAGLADTLPHAHVFQARDPSMPGAGGAVWTRLPVLHRGEVPGCFEQPSVRLQVPGGPDLEVTAVHTQPPARSPWQVAAWTEDLQLLPDPEPGVLRVLAGDFNSTLDHAAFRALLARGYIDAARAAGRASATTWTPFGRSHPRLVLDHVLVDPRIGVRSVVVVPVAGSDHRAVVTELLLPGA